MRKKYGRNRAKVLERVLKTTLTALLAFMAIQIGILGGNLLFDSDINIIRNIHVESFKSTLNQAIPLIDTVYNSGNISISFTGELSNLIAAIFNFNLDNPVTILNAQSSIMCSFYNNNYREYLAKEMEKEDKYDNINTPRDKPGDGSDGKAGDGDDDTSYGKPEDDGHEDSPGLRQDQSSIYYGGQEENGKEKPDDDSSTDRKKIVIKNESKQKVDDGLIEKLLKEDLNFKFDKKAPQILIYHTHTSEGYLRKLEDLDKKNIASRTQDNRYNVVRVGDELRQHLEKKYGFNVMHNGTVNDYDYNDSYINAGKTVNNIIKGNPTIKVIIDLHRDGLNGVEKLRRVTEINNKKAAQMFFVIGTDHENWKENFKLALKLHKSINDKYPGLMLPILLRNAKYNQQVAAGAFIIEIGGDGNTLDEALESTKYLAEAINDVLGSLK